MYDASHPVLTIEIAPLDPNASFRTPYGLIENYAGLLKSGFGDIATSDSTPLASFTARDWAQQTAFSLVYGSLEWVRLSNDGRLYRGVSAAVESEPNHELCGFTVSLRRVQLWSVMDKEPLATMAPRLPSGAQKLIWKARQGEEWETLLPAKAGAVTLVHHRKSPANTTVKVATADSFDKDQSFEMLLDLGGIAKGHLGEPAIRVMWGNLISIVFRGKGSKVRPQIEIRDRGEWRVRKVLSDSRALDDTFWNTPHILRVSRIGGRVVIELDEIGYHLIQFDGVSDKSKPKRATWPKAPLEVSIVGANCLIGANKLSGKGADGKFLTAGFTRQIGAPARIDTGRAFKANGEIATVVSDTLSMMVGDLLKQVSIEGSYQASGVITYVCRLACDESTAPLLCSLATSFPASATMAPPEPVNVAMAVNEWQVVSGDPENGQDAEATFSLSRVLLEKLVPNWKSVLMPYRPVGISLQVDSGGEAEVLFQGWIKPNNFDVDSAADQTIGVVCGDAITERLNQESGLIDERFAPIDLSVDPRRGALWGSEAVRDIIGTIMGQSWASNFNDGNPFKYYSAGTPPLIDNRIGGAGLSFIYNPPQKSNFYFPPPFGESAISLIQTIANYDIAIIWHDPRTNRIYYGDPVEVLIERGAVVNSSTPDFITTLSNQAEFEQSYNDVRVWGASDPSIDTLVPSLLMGRAGDSGAFSLDPLSRAQSWTRTLLLKPEYATLGIVDQQHVQEVAWVRWLEQEGRVPARYSLVFETGFLGPRWGEKISFTGIEELTASERRITKVIHSGTCDGQGSPRFSTTIEARSLTTSGQ